MHNESADDVQGKLVSSRKHETNDNISNATASVKYGFVKYHKKTVNIGNYIRSGSTPSKTFCC